MPFTDNFNRADASLEASATASGGGAWTHDGLIANALQISGNFLRCNTSDATGSAYKVPNQGSLDQYVQYKTQATTLGTGTFACCRLQDRSNFVGIRTGDGTSIGQIEVYRRVSGSLTSIYISAGNAYNSGDIIRLECVGAFFTVKKNGVAISGAVNRPIGATMSSTDMGVVARTVTGIVIDDFEAGAIVLTASTVATCFGTYGRAEVGRVDTATVLSGVSTWKGGDWVEKPAKVWTGSAWEGKPVKTWNGSAWVLGTEPTPQALVSFVPKTEEHIGNIAIDVTTANDPALTDIIVYLSPEGVALDKATHASRVLSATKASTFVANLGDPAIVNALANGDFSSSSAPPILGRGWTLSGGQLHHRSMPAGAATSPDGVTWTLQETPHDPTIELKWYSVCWAGSPQNQFVAVSNDGDLSKQIMTSPDGVTWTARAVPENMDLNCVTYSPTLNKFVALGFAGTNRGLISSDGITWTAIVNANLTALSWRDVCWGGPGAGLFVATNNVNTATPMGTSPDGLVWTRRSCFHGEWQHVIWAGPPLNLFVAVCNGSTRTYRVATSPDGITWTGRPTPFDATFLPRTIAYSPTQNRLVALGGSSTIRMATSVDGITWESINPGPFRGHVQVWQDIVWAGSPQNQFIAVPGLSSWGVAAGCATSPDGLNWTWQNDLPVQVWKSICWSPDLNKFVTTCITESAHADYCLWPVQDAMPGDAWRGYLTLTDFSTIAGFDASIRFTSAESIDPRTYLSEDVIVASTQLGLKSGRRVFATQGYNTVPAAGAQPSVQCSIDEIYIFKETPACAPQGTWDLHAFPRNRLGVEGPESTALNITVI